MLPPSILNITYELHLTSQYCIPMFPSFPTISLFFLYFFLCQPFLSFPHYYADILCIGSYQRTLKKLQKQQNRALGICLLLGSRTKVNVLNKMAKIELVSDRHNSHLLNFMYKRKESPQYINNAKGKTILFYAVVQNEARIIRTSVERSVYCKGARAWNSLPPTERNLPCHEAFKHHQKCNVKEITKNITVS